MPRLRTPSLRSAALPATPCTELADSVDDPRLRDEIRRNVAEFAIAPEAVARTIAFAIERPDDVAIGEIVIRSARQG